MSFINEIPSEKLEAFAVELIKRNYSRNLKYDKHIAEVKERDESGNAVVRVSAENGTSDLYYVMLESYSAEVYSFANATRTRFDGEVISFMLKEVKNKIGYAQTYNDLINSKQSSSPKKPLKQTTTRAEEDSEENC